MILYKKDTKNKIRILTVSSYKHFVVMRSGLLDGKLTENIRECTPKNEGRSNATTAIKQAELEAASIITKKLKEGYFRTQEEAENHVNLMPMLAIKADITTIKYPVYIQPKLDGIRLIATNKAKLSRKNREIDTIEHIKTDWLPEGFILDGELYAHGRTFQENTKAIKKYTKGLTEEIIYNVYDLPSESGTFSERFVELSKIIPHNSNIKIVPTYLVNDEDELLKYHKEFIADGFEGTMVRTDDTSYEFAKRSKSLLKLKDFEDEEFKVLDIIPSEKRPTQGVVVCETSDGKVFNATPSVTFELREQMLKEKDKYINKLATIEFFGLTDGGIPRFPVYKGLRDYE